MEHNFKHDLCVIGAGRIGLPWAAVLASEGMQVSCVDVDETVIESIAGGAAPFDEPELDRLIQEGITSGNLSATTDQDTVGSARAIGITLNAPNGQIKNYLDVLSEYGSRISSSQTVINRTTLPAVITDDAQATLADAMEINRANLDYLTFPERLVEGSAIKEIKELPKIVGTDDGSPHPVIEWMTDTLSGETYYTDHRTAITVKLIDNTYRDARFAIANQFAHIAEQLGVDSHEAITLANQDYPRNNVPTPGTVGGKCLTKDPYFLTERWVENLPVDLFKATRGVNESYTDLVVQHVCQYDPSTVTVLGAGYKRNVPDEAASPAVEIVDELESMGIDVEVFEPLRDKTCCDSDADTALAAALDGADVVVLAVNHRFFEARENQIRETVDGAIVDVWGMLESAPNVDRVGSGHYKRNQTVLLQD